MTETWTRWLTEEERDILNHGAMDEDFAVREEYINWLARPLAASRALVAEWQGLGVSIQSPGKHIRGCVAVNGREGCVPNCLALKRILALTEKDMLGESDTEATDDAAAK